MLAQATNPNRLWRFRLRVLHEISQLAYPIRLNRRPAELIEVPSRPQSSLRIKAEETNDIRCVVLRQYSLASTT